jgi:hypothetical protein
VNDLMDWPSLCVLGTLFAFIVLETMFRVQLLWTESLVWVLDRLADRRELTRRLTLEEELLSDYMIG